MSMPLHRIVMRAVLLPVLWLAIGPQVGISQDRQIVFNQVSVSGGEAGILLEFADGNELSIVLADGRVRVDGEDAGSYTPGGALETSWRSLLGQAVAVEPGTLGDLFSEWSPPSEISATSSPASERLVARLSEAFAPATVTSDPTEGTVSVDLSESGTGGDSVLAGLVRRTDRLRELAAALEDIDVEDLSIHLGGTVEIDEGETVDTSVLLIDGTLELDGTLDGDALLIGGRMEIGSEGRVTGVVRNSGASISGDRSRVEGGVVSLDARLDEIDGEVSDLEDAVRDAVRDATANVRSSPFDSGRSPLRSFGRGLGDLLQNIVTFGLLLAIGLGALYFFPLQFEVVSRTAGNATGRSLLVGVAGLVLAIPVFLLGIVFLAVSIIGIPLLVAWIPLFPFALGIALLFGLLAVARNLGRWVSGHRAASFDGLDASRPAVQIGWGLAVLLGAYILSNLFEMGGPWFGVFEGALLFAGTAVTTIALCVGLGSVILSRAGRDRTYTAPERRSGLADDPDAPEAPDVR